MSALEANRAEIERFVNTLFLHADRDNFVSLRAFRDDADGVWRRERWRTVRIGDTLDALIEAAFRFSGSCAAAEEPVCFAPPIATFKNADRADQASLANGLVISTELDSTPRQARERLEQVLGPATIVALSGGLWTDPKTGEEEDKLHLHWRLVQPTRTKIEHDFLRECNGLACRLAGGDPTAISLVHPLRWAGSWHKKATPRLARIVAFNPAIELTLADALTILRSAVEPPATENVVDGTQRYRPSQPQADALDITAALAVIPNADIDWDQWNTIGMATWRATDGSPAGYAAFAAWSSKSGKFNPAATRARWAHYSTSPPTQIGAGTLFHMAKAARRDFVKPSACAMPPRPGKLPPGFDAPPPIGQPVENGHDTETGWASTPVEEPWPEIEAEALHGLAGEVVDAIAPTTEADPIAILTHFLVEFGNILGRKSYCVADGAQHYPNLYALVIGRTSKGRKGTAARRVEQIMSAVDIDWHQHCIASGLSSGEGIIHAVHDEIRSREKVADGKGKPPKYVEVVKDPGVNDKRLLIHEPEFAGALEVMKRDGSTLSRVIREGYDSGNLRVLTKNSPERATGAHISIIGHITVEEYRVSLDRTSMVNGYANRFLNVLTRRSRELPFGGVLDDATVALFAGRIRQALDNSALWQQITFSPEGREAWISEYHDLSAQKPGLFGSIVARGEAHTLRLALAYALLDQRRYIDPSHLRAALAFWRYCEASAKYVFGDALGNPLADELLRSLRAAGPDGLTRTEIYNLLGRHCSAERTGAALGLLLQHNKVRRITRPSGPNGGRPLEIWIST